MVAILVDSLSIDSTGNANTCKYLQMIDMAIIDKLEVANRDEDRDLDMWVGSDLAAGFCARAAAGGGLPRTRPSAPPDLAMSHYLPSSDLALSLSPPRIQSGRHFYRWHCSYHPRSFSLSCLLH